MALLKVKGMDKCYKSLGHLLLILGGMAAFFWGIRLIFRSVQYIDFVDDALFLARGLILLTPLGFWFKYGGDHLDRYDRVNIVPLLLISVGPAIAFESFVPECNSG